MGTRAGYVAYSSLAQDHHVSIEVLAANYSALAGKNLGLFPDRYVEGEEQGGKGYGVLPPS